MLADPLWPAVEAADRILSMGQIEQFDIQTVCKQMTCSIELLEIELFEHLTVYEQMTDVWLNCWWYIAILATIYLNAKKWVILNRIVSDT